MVNSPVLGNQSYSVFYFGGFEYFLQQPEALFPGYHHRRHHLLETPTLPPHAPLDMKEQRESTVAANKRSIAIMKSDRFFTIWVETQRLRRWRRRRR